MTRTTRRAAALLALLAPFAAAEAQPADVEVYDRTSGRILPSYWHDGDCYVAGEPGHRYELRVRNQTGERVLAVASVDGVNVISGETAAHDQTGYVIDGYGRVDIDGWRKSMAQVASFYFTDLPDSYAARTGRPDNVGVIGVALFRERVRYPVYGREDRMAQSDAASAAPPGAPAAQESDAGGLAGRLSRKERLGTGHGERRHSAASYVDFERASTTPDAVIRIFYDSRRNLVAQGVIPRRYHDPRRVPEPFPSAFVPDP